MLTAEYLANVGDAGDGDARHDAHQGGARGVHEGGRRGEQHNILQEYCVIK